MSNKLKRIIFFAVYLAYTSVYIARLNLSMAGPGLIDRGIIDTAQLGALGSVFSVIYAAGRLVNGSIGDRTPPWIMLTCGLVLAGISNMLVSLFPPFYGIFILWGANAYAQSMLWSSVLCVVSGLYDNETAKKKTSIMVTSVAGGNIAGILVNTYLIENLGLNFAFVIPGLLTVFFGFLVCVLTKNIEASDDSAKSKSLPLTSVLKNRQIWAMGIPAVLHGVMKENVGLWMAVYVVDTYMVDLSTSAFYVLIIPLFGFVGRMIYPALYKLFGNDENKVSAAGFVLSIVASLPLFYDKTGMLISVILLSLVYTAASVINTSILSIFPLSFAKTGNVSSVSGIMDFGAYLGAGVASAVYGVVIERCGYIPMFVSWTVISLISIIPIIKMIKSRRKENEADN